MIKIKYSLFIFSLFFINIAFAQEFKLSGTLVNQDDKMPLVGATVKLVSLRDTLKIDYRSSGVQGEFMFNKLARGRFRLEVTYIGFEKYVQDVMDQNQKLGSK